MKKTVQLLFIISSFFPALSCAQASFIIEYEDAAGYGFYSNTPVTPIGGNTGITLGEQRRIAFEKAISHYDKSFTSSIPIHVQAHFENRGGTAYSAVLASAGPEWFNYNFPKAPMRNIAYPSALASKISGMDLSDASAGIADIDVLVNADVDGSALGNSDFYYGLDGQGTRYDIDFVTVISHELMHGLGFLSVIDTTAGYKFGCGTGCNTNSIGDVFSTKLARIVGNTPVPLLSMNQSDRLAAATATDEVVWVGTQTTAEAQNLYGGTLKGYPLIYTPSPAESGSSLSHTAFSLNPTAIMQPAYSGALELSSVNLAMLADIGWGSKLADLEVHILGSEDGSGLFTVILSNNTSETINNITLDLSTNSTRIKAVDSQNCTGAAQMMNCAITSLSGQQIVSLDFNVSGADGQASVTASLDADIVELNADNNIANGIVTVAEGSATTPDRSLNSGESSNPAAVTSNGGGSLDTGLLVMVLLLLGRQYYSVTARILFKRVFCSTEG